MVKLPLLQLFIIVAILVVPFYGSRKLVLDKIKEQKLALSVSCTPDREQAAIAADEQEIFLLPGSGSYTWKINTDNDSAQQYFNQGVNTYYGFHIIESIASFKKAAAFDPQNPMIWWGLALAYGPNINDVGYSASPEALLAVKNAVRNIDKANTVKQSLIRAMEVRYSEDSTRTRESLNQLYADGMKAAYEKHPGSADVLALYADAMMLQHPWDLWEVKGAPKPWTPLIREVLETGLKIDRKHPGLNHYYIHVMEPSPMPQKATASADILGTITPGLAHLVHMPSHIYLRTGQFNRGVEINQQAVDRFQQYYTLYPAVVNGAFIYDLHNRHMLVNCAMHAGRYTTAIEAARSLQAQIDSATLALPPPMGSLVQYVYMTPVLILTRFEKWDSLLAMQKPANSLVYANIIYEFGKGMAEAARNDTRSARLRVDKIDELMKEESLAIEMKPFSAAIEGAKTARNLLVGEIHLREKEFAKAVNHLQQAAETELAMVYNEPRDWFLNPHQYLGNAHLQAGDYAKAEEVFRKDLSLNANNVWSLRGLLTAQKKLQNKRAAASTAKALKQAAARSDGFW